MGDPLADLAVVTVTYRSATTIEAALQALPTERLAGTVVVDNASDDDTVARVRALALPRVQVIEHGRNAGFGAGNNIGVAHAPPSRWIAFLNPDAVASTGDLVALVDHLAATPRAAVAVPRLVGADGPLSSAGRLPTVPGLLRHEMPEPIRRLLPERRLPPTYARTGPVETVEGACMVVDRQALADVGGFDERYFLFFEESDLARRLAERGRTVELVAAAEVRHAVGASRAHDELGARPHHVRSAIAYLDAWHGARAVATYRLGVRVAWWLRWRAGRLPDAHRRALLEAL